MGRNKKRKRAEFPKINIDLAIDYITQTISKVGTQIVSYEEIGKSLKKAGGNLSRIVASLVDFGLIEKGERPKEWKITELGWRIAQEGSEADKFKAFLTPSIHSKIWDQYKQVKPSPSALMQYLQREGFTAKESKKLSKLFLKSYDQFATRTPLAVGDKLQSKQSQKPTFGTSKDNCKMAYLIGCLFGEELEDKKGIIKEIKEIAEKNGFDKFAGVLEGLESFISDIDDEDSIKKEIDKLAPIARKLFKKDLGIE